MNLRDQKIWNTISAKHEIGEEVNIPYFNNPLKVVSNEDFVCKVLSEISGMKYLYNLEGPMMYALHYGIAPESAEECKEIVHDALRELGY